MFGIPHLGSTWIAIAGLLINMGLAFIPAGIAGKKGYSFAGYWCLGFFLSFVLGIIFAAAIPVKSESDQMEADIQPVKRTFSGSYLGFVIMAALVAFMIFLVSVSPYFFSSTVLAMIVKWLVMFGLPAIAVALTTRAKGPDLSLGAVPAFSAVIAAKLFVSSGSTAAGIAVALAAAAIIGAVSGTLTVYMRLPSMLSSIIIFGALNAATRAISQGRPIITAVLKAPASASPLYGAAVILLLAIIAAWLFVYFTRLGKLMNARIPEENRSLLSFGAYVAGAVLAGISGIYGLYLTGIASPADSSSSISFVLFIFGAIMSSRLLDNRKAPVFSAFGAALLYVLLKIGMNFLNIASWYQLLFFTLFTLALVTIGAFANRRAIANMLSFK